MLIDLTSITTWLKNQGAARAQQAKLASDQAARRLEAQKLDDLYFRRPKETRALVEAELKRLTGDDAVATKAPYRLLPVMRRLVDVVAMCYSDPPTRTAGEGTAGDAYQALLKASDIEDLGPRVEAMAHVHNTVLVRPFWDDERKRMEFRVYTPSHTDVLEDPADHTRAKMVQIYVVRPGANGVDETVVYAWTPETAEKITSTGVYPMEGAEGTDNDYGELPFAVLRLEDQGEFWGSGATDLAEGQISYQALESALGKNAVAQGFSKWLGINLGLQGSRVTNASEISPYAKVAWGPDKVHCVDGVERESLPPSLEAITPQPMLSELTNVLANLLRSLCWTRGLSSDRAVSLISGSVGQAQSGVAKAMDNADLEELRKRTIPALRRFEADLYRVTKLVYDTDAAEHFGALPEPEAFSVDFAEPVIRRTTAEVNQDRLARMEMGLATPVDYEIEDNPDLADDRAQAEQNVRERLEFNREMMDLNALRGSLRGAEPAA